MISLQHLIQNPDLYKTELKNRFLEQNMVDKILSLYQDWRNNQENLEDLRRQVNLTNKEIPKLNPEERKVKIQTMKSISIEIKNLERLTKSLRTDLDNLVLQIPNLSWSGIPIGKDDNSNVETAVYGKKPEFDFQPKNYYDLPIFKRDYLDQKGVQAAGFRGYYLTGELAKFQRVVFNWVLDSLLEQGFEYVMPPILVNQDLLYGTGFFPSGKEDIYEVSEGDKTKYLVGTSEAPLMFLYANQTLNLDKPKKLTAWTTCFRKEVGAYGKDTKGGIRVHQFEKVETVWLCKPEDGNQVFEQMTKIFQTHCEKLDLYFHDLEVSTGDNSLKNHRMIDIEAWFPAQNQFREICSSSMCTDYQTRPLNIQYLNSEGQKALAHSLNCTGLTARTIWAILEQNQLEDGRVKVPDILVARFGKEFLV